MESELDLIISLPFFSFTAEVSHRRAEAGDERIMAILVMIIKKPYLMD